jgi:hypothetical protein
MSGSHCGSITYDECALECAQEKLEQEHRKSRRFINPHRLFHGVWLPQWLEERPEVSEKAKKLYAYLSVLRGRQRMLLAFIQPTGREIALLPPAAGRRHVMRLVQGAFHASANCRNKRQ